MKATEAISWILFIFALILTFLFVLALFLSGIVLSVGDGLPPSVGGREIVVALATLLLWIGAGVSRYFSK